MEVSPLHHHTSTRASSARLTRVDLAMLKELVFRRTKSGRSRLGGTESLPSNQQSGEGRCLDCIVDLGQKTCSRLSFIDGVSSLKSLSTTGYTNEAAEDGLNAPT